MASKFSSAMLEPITDLLGHTPLDPLRAFHAMNETEAQTWQKDSRASLIKMLGFIDDAAVTFEPEEIFSENRQGIRHRKIHISTGRWSRVPIHLLYPAGYPKHRGLVLAYEGHGYGVNDIVGVWEDGSFRDKPDGYQRDFAMELCRRGFVVAAPEVAGFGERQNNYTYVDKSIGQREPTTCQQAAAYAIMLGKSLLGLRVRDSIRLLDFLTEEGLVLPGKVGAMGISGGGMLALFHAAIDERIVAGVISGYFCSFRSSVLSFSHCPCNFVPHLYANFEMVDVATLILPRPLFVESGTRDPIFPIDAVKMATKELKDRSRIFRPEGEVELDVFEGRHRIGGNRCYDFLSEQLSK